MRIIGPQFFPLSFRTLSNVTNRQQALCFFFESKLAVPADLRALLRDSVAATELAFTASPQGLLLDAGASIGFKAIEGSRYLASYGATWHWPKYVEPLGSVQEEYITIEYGKSLAQCNVALFRRLCGPQNFVGVIASRPNPPPFLGAKSRVTYSYSVKADAVLSKSRDNAIAISGNVALASTPTDLKPWSIADGDQSNEITDGQSGTEFILSHEAGTILRTAFLATKGEVPDVLNTKTIGYAIVVCPKAISGNNSSDLVTFGCPVGSVGSGTYIELEKLTLTTGEYANIVQVRTGMEAS